MHRSRLDNADTTRIELLLEHYFCTLGFVVELKSRIGPRMWYLDQPTAVLMDLSSGMSRCGHESHESQSVLALCCGCASRVPS